MRIFGLIVLSASLLSATLPALAQSSDPLTASSTQLYNACIANGQGGPTECGCMAGFFGGRLAEDEFLIVAALNPHIGPTGEIADLTAAHQSMFAARDAAGISETRFNEVVARLSTLDVDGQYGDRICLAFRGK